jgi:hypothetical protein
MLPSFPYSRKLIMTSQENRYMNTHTGIPLLKPSVNEYIRRVFMVPF